MKKILSALIGVLVAESAALAVCPVCTVAVGAGLEGARLMGVDDVITGIWAGGLTLSLFFWTVGWLKKHNVDNFWWQIVVPFVGYYALLGMVYMLPDVTFGANTLWGVDKFLLGVIIGTVSFYVGARWYIKIKRKNGGRASFAFQKVVVPLSLLALMSVLFWLITK